MADAGISTTVPPVSVAIATDASSSSVSSPAAGISATTPSSSSATSTTSSTSSRRSFKPCSTCGTGRAVIRHHDGISRLCKACFIIDFEETVHDTIMRYKIFSPGERIAIGVSGGKDSTVMAHVLDQLNRKYKYGIEIVLVAVDEGIAGYRDGSLERVKQTAATLNLPLNIVTYEKLYGWPMDRVVMSTGGRNSCSYCGIFRRQALDMGCAQMKADKIAIGHNADDIAETVLMNLLRGDIARLGRCVRAVTGGDSVSGGGASAVDNDSKNRNSSSDSSSNTNEEKPKPQLLPRVKPLLQSYEKEIVAYAHYTKLQYHATECSYSPAAYRGFLRELIKELEVVHPAVITNIIRAAAFWRVDESSDGVEDDGEEDEAGAGGRSSSSDTLSVTSGTTQKSNISSSSSSSSSKLVMKARVAAICSRCGYLCSGSSGLCQACNLLYALAAGTPRLILTSGGGGGGSGGGGTGTRSSKGKTRNILKTLTEGVVLKDGEDGAEGAEGKWEQKKKSKKTNVGGCCCGGGSGSGGGESCKGGGCMSEKKGCCSSGVGVGGVEGLFA